MDVRSSDAAEEISAEPRQKPREPRPDGGKDAWLFLAGCFTIEMLLWGEWLTSSLRGYLASPLLRSRHVPILMWSSTPSFLLRFVGIRLDLIQ